MAAVSVGDSVFGHWREQTQRAVKAWRMYRWSYEELKCDPWDKPANKYHECARKYHPDKIPAGKEKYAKYAREKFLGCKIAINYIRAFRRRYGDLDILSRADQENFLKEFAGMWATLFTQTK